MQQNIFKIQGKIQHYAWGGKQFIPALLNIENVNRTTFAEYWMGAHPSAPSTTLIATKNISLLELIQQEPVRILSQKILHQFGELPYLLKVLDVHEMLSIQVHPTKAEAEKGFAAENAAGTALTATNRNYKDKNHKPEIMVALSEFWLLHGFKTMDAMKNVLQSVPQFAPLYERFTNDGYKVLYEYVMTLPQAEVDAMLAPVVKNEQTKRIAGKLSKTNEGYWVTKLFDGNGTLKNIDRGIFSIYFFNIVKVAIGDAVFQQAGVPHAYLEGQNIELMANSDNVLRAGLTSKYIDVPELMKHTLFEPITPNVMKGTKINECAYNYPCPVPDFGIHKIILNKQQSLANTSSSTEILFVTEGAVAAMSEDNHNIHLQKGEAAVVCANTAYHLTGNDNTTLFKAFVPL